MPASLKRLTATGLAKAGPIYLKSVVLVGGSVVGTADIQDTAGGGGTNVLSLSALSTDSASWTSGGSRGVYFEKGVYVTVGGTGAVVSVELEG